MNRTTRTIQLVTAEFGEGAQVTGCQFGPRALLDFGIVAALRSAGNTVQFGETASENGAPSGTRTSAQSTAQTSAQSTAQTSAQSTAAPTAVPDKLQAVSAFLPALAAQVGAAAASGNFPLVLGGDHSCAVGTWSGVANAWRETGRIGLIWIDAHLDSHTPATSESQAPHGMPLAALLGHGAPAMTDLSGWQCKLLPQHVVVIGARSYETAETALLARLGVRVMSIDEVAERGLSACVAEAIDRVTNGTCGYGVSFDLDAIDPLEATAVGSPAARGLAGEQAVAALRLLAGDERLLGFELVEYNPEFDDAGKSSANLCQRLLLAALTDDVANVAGRLLTHSTVSRRDPARGPVYMPR